MLLRFASEFGNPKCFPLVNLVISGAIYILFCILSFLFQEALKVLFCSGNRDYGIRHLANGQLQNHV